MSVVDSSEQAARELDAGEAFPARSAQFHVPPAPGGTYPQAAYLAGNSLGLQPRAARLAVDAELDAWATLGVTGHHKAERPWVSFHELLRAPAARLVGARPGEVVAMNSLTVNLHLLMASFYRPTADRYAILVEDTAFPSDSYAVRSQAGWHGYDPDSAVIRVRTGDVHEALARDGERIALVLLGGVNYYSGELLDVDAITRAGHDAGAVVGWDLAHAAGNVPLRLHDWDVDFAAWCSYKYLNSGPGSVAGAFVHERHLADRALPKLAGWWSTDPATRFDMAPTVTPVDAADAWQLSNPPILAMAPVVAALGMFDDAGMDALRGKSIRLTSYLEALLDEVCPDGAWEIITPREPHRRGAQLSVRLAALAADAVVDRLERDHGVVADARRPNVVRLAPAPLYSTFHDCWRAATALAEVARDGG